MAIPDSRQNPGGLAWENVARAPLVENKTKKICTGHGCGEGVAKAGDTTDFDQDAHQVQPFRSNPVSTKESNTTGFVIPCRNFGAGNFICLGCTACL
jgi:hypothetical protein